MDKGTIEATRDTRVANLKELAFVEGPCLTITVPIQPAPNASRMDYRRLKSAAQSAELPLQERGMDAREIREFLDPITQMEGNSWGSEFGSLVVLRSPETFRYFQVHQELKDSATVADHFHILPFFRAMQESDRHFFLLALSLGRTRLLRCTDQAVEEIPFAADTPASLEDWLSTRSPNAAPDHGNEEGVPGGRSTGNFTSTADRDNVDPHIANFFHRINEAVVHALRGETAPLVLAGVEFETSMYTELNSYPHLAERHVSGAPDSLKGAELHKRALEVVKFAYEEPMRKALQMYERLGGSERVAHKPADAVAAAAAGRVGQLFVADGANHLGIWDKNEMRVTSEGTGEDLLNIAVLQTLAHAGEVWVTSPETVPGGGSVAALLRF